MKLKKTLAAVAAMAVAASAVSAMSLSASAVTAGATSIDFEDGDYSFVYMNTDSGADASVLSVEEYDGSMQLKVDVQDKTLVPKVWFDLKSIMDVDQYTQIYTIEFDLTIVPKNAEDYVGWAGGAIGAAGSFPDQVNPDWSQGTWDGGAYDPGEVASIHCERKFLLSSTQYTADSENPFFGLMRWAVSNGGDYYMYIDNIVFKTKGGDTLTVGVTASEEASEEEAAEGEEEAAETEAAETEAEVTEAEVVETEAEVVETAPAADYSNATGTVITDTEATSSGAWGQAITLTTVKNEGGVFDPTVLTSDKVVVVYYTADSAPELVLQSWSGGESWAKVAASDLSTDGVAVYTYDDMVAAYGSSDFESTLDAFIVGDTGSALTVSEVLLVDAAAGAVSEDEVIVEEAEEVVVTEAAAVEEVAAEPVAVATTTSTTTGNVSALAIAGVMAAAGAVAFASRKRK